MAARQGPTVSILVMIAVGLVVGGAVAMIIEGIGLGGRLVALVSGAVAVLVASVVRFKLLSGIRQDGEEPNLVGAMVVYGAISAIAGSLAGHDVYTALDARMPLLLGAIAGLFSACVMSISMVTLHENRRPL